MADAIHTDKSLIKATAKPDFTGWTYPPHRFANIFPMMLGEPLEDLAADIKKNGLKEPIDTWQDQIIDGRNRYAACKIAKVGPLYRHMTFRDDDTALAYVVTKNLKRRHLNHQQRVEVAARLADMRQGERTDLVAPSVPAPKVSQTQAAKMLDVSVSSIGYHKAVAEKAPELLPAVEAGKISLKAAATTVRRAEAKVIPLDPADANRQRVANAAMREDEHLARVVAGKGQSWERLLDKALRVEDILRWRMNAFDSQRREVADAYFVATSSRDEKKKHADLVVEWMREHERGDAPGDNPDGEPLPVGVFDGERWRYKL